MNGRGGEYLFERIGVAELGVGVFGRVGVIDPSDFGKVVGGGSVSCKRQLVRGKL